MIKFFISILFMSAGAMAMDAGQEYTVRHTTRTLVNTRSIVEGTGGTIKRQLFNFNGVVAHLTAEQAERLSNQGFLVQKTVKMKVMGYPTKAPRVTEETEKIPWGIKDIQAPEAQKLKNGDGEGVTVCIVDTGIANDHPVLAGSVVGGFGVVKSVTPGKDEWYDDMGHGTHVSGTVAAHAAGLLGVAPKAKLYAIKVLDSSGSGTDADVADGIKACIGHGQVINMSLGGGEPTQLMQEALDAAVKAGIQIACAAGNDSGPVNSPANQKGCVAVSAIEKNGKLASFSCRGKEIAFAAPGAGVKSSVPGGGFATWDGTSMATPHVAGTMAIMLSTKKTVLKAKDLKLPAEEQGAGEINALKTAQ